VVFTATRPGPVEWRFGDGVRAHVVRLVPRLIGNDVDAMLLAGRAGRGVGRALSYQVADDLASGALVRLLPELEPPALPVQLVVPSARHLSAKARGFVDHAARALATLAVIRAPARAR
jgi:DNA-binding transcriptional LysR family regulator